MINDPFFQSTSDYYLELAHVLINSLSVDKKLNLFIRETVIHSTKQLDYINTDSCIIFVPVELEQKDEVLPKLIVVFEVVGDNCCTHLVTTAKNNHEHFITTELLPNAKIKNYNLHELYSDSNIRRTLNKAKYYSHDKRLHNIYCKQYALALTTKLYKIPVGKGISPNNEDSDEKEYQKTIGDILDLFFDECDAEREIEKRVSNNSFRFDLTYYIPPFSDILWDQIREHSKSSHILIECKNSKEDGELIKAVSQVQKYFSSTTVGNFAIIIIRNKSTRKKNKEYIRMLQNKEKYIIILDDNDLKNMVIEKFTTSMPIIFQPGDNKRIIVEYSPLMKLYKMIADERLELV